MHRVAETSRIVGAAEARCPDARVARAAERGNLRHPWLVIHFIRFRSHRRPGIRCPAAMDHWVADLLPDSLLFKEWRQSDPDRKVHPIGEVAVDRSPIDPGTAAMHRQLFVRRMIVVQSPHRVA